MRLQTPPRIQAKQVSGVLCVARLVLSRAFDVPPNAATVASLALNGPRTVIYLLKLMGVVVGLTALLPHPELPMRLCAVTTRRRWLL